jgi:hypothetical protein
MTRRRSIVSVLGLLFVLVGPARAWPEDKPGLEEKKTVAPNKGERLQLLESVGALAAGQLYQTYLNIGLLADGVAEGAYEVKEARQVLQTALGLVELQDKHLARIAKLELTPKDRDALGKLRKLGVLLRQQVEELDAYWKTDDEAHAARYEKARQQAWSGISSLLGLKK